MTVSEMFKLEEKAIVIHQRTEMAPPVVFAPLPSPSSGDWRGKVLVVISAVVLALWSFASQVETPDFLTYTGPWLEHIRTNGQLRAFAHPFGNYTPPYLYLLSALTMVPGDSLVLIKALSSLSALWLAFAIYRLLGTLHARRPVEAAAWSLLLPTVFLNAPFLGQADCFWVAPCLLAIRAGTRFQTLPMVLWCGVAIAFKAQAIFLAPFAIAVLIQARAPLWHWIVPALVYAAAMFPAWLAGWPAFDLLTVYVRQAQWQPEGQAYVGNAPSPWAVFGAIDLDTAAHSFWLGYTAASIGAVAFVAFVASSRFTPVQMLAAASLSAAAVPFLLPAMHERYMMLADVAAFAYAFARRTRRSLQIAVAMQLGSVLAICSYITPFHSLSIVGAIFVAAAMLLLIGELRTAVQGSSAGYLASASNETDGYLHPYK